MNPKVFGIYRDSKFITSLWVQAIVYIVAIGITEFILYYLSVPSGIVLYFAILIAVIVHSTLARDEAPQGLWLAFGLVPLIRIFSIVILITDLAAFTRYIFIGVPVLIGIYTVARRLKYSFDDIGLNNRHLGVQMLIGVAGPGLGIADYMILKPDSLVQGSFVQLIFPALVLLIFTGLIEELAFRGVMQRAAKALGSWGWLSIAPVYALLQIGWGSLPHLFFTLGVALYFGFVVDRMKSLVGVSLAHGLLNIMLFLVLPNILEA